MEVKIDLAINGKKNYSSRQLITVINTKDFKIPSIGFT